jgi:hypothetical protein
VVVDKFKNLRGVTMSQHQDIPTKDAGDGSPYAKSLSIPMTSESIRTIESNGAVKIISGLTGSEVSIVTKRLNKHYKGIVAKACVQIEEKLKGSEYEEAIEITMRATTFCATSSKHLGAYSGQLNDFPIVILNSKTFAGSADDFTVTILHELLHLVLGVYGDESPDSLEEARHDLACYGFLGVPVPLDHWAFTKYPQLLDEINDDAATMENILP